ncbi:MAG: hypothetical protein E6767_08255 [Dysgonomonas sp.]|nr:hypothetical protein [Dysgonomonas sp.]
MEIINYDTLLEKYAGIAFEKQYSLSEVIGENDWNVDLNTGLISFGAGLSFPMQILGTYSFESATWLWAWANEASNIPENLLDEAKALKQLGEEYNIEFLTMPEYKMESVDVHALGFIASGKFESSAYYAGNYGSGIILVTIKSEEVENVAYNEQARILSIFPQLISTFAVNHKRTLKNYVEAKGYIVTDNENELIADKGQNVLKAEFDELDRLTNLNGEIKA